MSGHRPYAELELRQACMRAIKDRYALHHLSDADLHGIITTIVRLAGTLKPELKLLRGAGELDETDDAVEEAMENLDAGEPVEMVEQKKDVAKDPLRGTEWGFRIPPDPPGTDECPLWMVTHESYWINLPRTRYFKYEFEAVDWYRSLKGTHNAASVRLYGIGEWVQRLGAPVSNIIVCPVCGGSGEEPLGRYDCRVCDGAGQWEGTGKPVVLDAQVKVPGHDEATMDQIVESITAALAMTPNERAAKEQEMPREEDPAESFNWETQKQLDAVEAVHAQEEQGQEVPDWKALADEMLASIIPAEQESRAEKPDGGDTEGGPPEETPISANPFFDWVRQQEPYTVITGKWVEGREQEVMDSFTEYFRNFLAARLLAHQVQGVPLDKIWVRVEVAHG